MRAGPSVGLGEGRDHIEYVQHPILKLNCFKNTFLPPYLAPQFSICLKNKYDFFFFLKSETCVSIHARAIQCTAGST